MLHRADIYDMKKEDDGSISFVISDLFDFDYLYENENDDWKEKGIKYINNNAYRQQKANKLEPYILYIPIKFTKQELEEVLYSKWNQ